ncbi:MAG: efflux RND transporter periplasmic adaptor subunit [Elusimicrobiota bacterium]|jgi:macrolide-specific efflux system membrane fusion protein
MKKMIILLILIVLAAGIGFIVLRQKGMSRGPLYIPAAVQRGAISDIVDTTGSVSPLNRVEVNPSVGGRVDEILVEEGDRVKRGQVLAYLSSTDRVTILDAARAKGEEAVAKWEKTYRPTPVLSPMNGTIIKRGVVQGQTVTTSSVMFALADDLIVIAQVDESDVGRVKTGQHAILTLDAYPKKETEGIVFQILNEGVSVSNVITYYVKIRPLKVPAYYKSEMSANIKVIVSQKKDALLLPVTAITEKEDGTRCVYKGADPRSLTLTPLQIGVDDGTNVEILSGVDEGETVFTASSGYMPQAASSDSNPFMPSGPKKTTSKTGKSSSNTGPPPM